MKNILQFARQSLTDVGMMAMVLFTILLRYKIIHFGLPYSLHPDETYIYKDALKILLLYKNLDFSQSYNLVDWLMAIWTGVMYGAGKLFGYWAGFTDFQNALLLEDGRIILGYRFLSLLVGTAGVMVLYRLCRKLTANKLLSAIFILTFVLNPVEIISDNWIKYDPFVFLTLSILLYFSYSYFILGQKDKSRIIYILSFIALTVRIDFIAFLVTFFLFDGFESFYRKPDLGVTAFLKRNFAPALTGMLIYFAITLVPVCYIYAHFFSSSANMGISSSMGKVIFSRTIHEINSGHLFTRILNNIDYYFRICLSALGPLIMVCGALFFFRHKNSMFFLLYPALIAFPVMLYGFHATHYFLSISVILIFINCHFISRIKNFRTQVIVSCFNLVFVSSVSIAFLSMIFTVEDPRIESIDFILRHTGAEDLLAVETHSVNGYSPPLAECSDVLMEKYKTVSEIGGGTGQTYLQRAQCVQENCRAILDITTFDYFTGSRYENFWINTYDTASLAKRNPKFYITTYSLTHDEPFYNYVLNNYSLVRKFAPEIYDKRLSFLMESEFYFKPVSIYKRNL